MLHCIHIIKYIFFRTVSYWLHLDHYWSSSISSIRNHDFLLSLTFNFCEIILRMLKPEMTIKTIQINCSIGSNESNCSINGYINVWQNHEPYLCLFHHFPSWYDRQVLIQQYHLSRIFPHIQFCYFHRNNRKSPECFKILTMTIIPKRSIIVSRSISSMAWCSLTIWSITRMATPEKAARALLTNSKVMTIYTSKKTTTGINILSKKNL